MREKLVLLGLGAALSTTAFGATIYNNLTPTNSIAVATRPANGSAIEIETADDFVVGAQTFVNSATFDGLIVPGATGGSSSISEIVAEMYRVFPLDSNTTRTANVPTRTNSPSDVAFASRDSVGNGLSFTSTVLSSSFTALNSVQPGGIHAGLAPATGGNGAITGQEVQITVTFSSAFNLPANHYFFIPQVSLTNGAQFYWLSASRPITGAGTTPFPAGQTDLQAWTRDNNLDPDWLRIGTDIVGGTTPPTFDLAFSLDGTTTPEPVASVLILSGLALIGLKRRRASL